MSEKVIKTLLGEAEFRFPERVWSLMSENLYLRAMGHKRVERANDVGKSTRQLRRWEQKIEQNLSPMEEAELVRLCVDFEVDKRIEESEQAKVVA